MEAIFSCCAGLDVHKKTVVACIRRLEPDGQVDQRVRTFGTMTDELLELADWLAGQGVIQVALESTGVFWKPVFNLLEARFTMIVVNAQHIKQVPGRKTDVKDCQWIAQLLQHGLLRASFVPPRPIRELRDLTRQRTQLIRQRATQANRLQKVLEDANIKLAGVATDILGRSGRAMIQALIAGESDPARMAELARRRMRAKIPLLVRALTGRVTDHHRYQLRTLMEQVEHLEGRIERLDARVQEVAAPLAAEVERLSTIPGINLPGGRGDHRRGGRRHDGVPDGGPSLLVGRDVAGQSPECRQALQRADDQGQPVAEVGAGPGGLGGQPHQADSVEPGLPSVGQADRQETGGGRRGSEDLEAGLRVVDASDGLSGAIGSGPGGLNARPEGQTARRATSEQRTGPREQKAWSPSSVVICTVIGLWIRHYCTGVSRGHRVRRGQL